jgi:hypothetical protein
MTCREAYRKTAAPSAEGGQTGPDNREWVAKANESVTARMHEMGSLDVLLPSRHPGILRLWKREACMPFRCLLHVPVREMMPEYLRGISSTMLRF